MSYQLSSHAKDDLENILIFTQKTWGKKQQKAYLQGLQTQLEILAANPLMGKKRADIHEKCLTFSYKSHAIFYRLEGDAILVVAILHKRMHPDIHFKQRNDF